MSLNNEALHNISGIGLPADAYVVIINTDWNEEIISELTNGCINELKSLGIDYEIITVPGAVEIPFAIKSCWENNYLRPHAFIALGCVIKGDTPHFDYVCNMVSDGIAKLNIELPVPTIFGVLTVLNNEQAKERIGGKHGHKGSEAAITAAKMISLNYKFENTEQ